MIGYEDKPERSAEICICEIFGSDVGSDRTTIGVGVHPFGDPRIVDDFTRVTLPIDAREFHVYTAEWTVDGVAFFVDGDPVKTVEQSLAYPMQLMLSIYEFPRLDADEPTRPYPKAFVVDYVRGYRVTTQVTERKRAGLWPSFGSGIDLDYPRTDAKLARRACAGAESVRRLSPLAGQLGRRASRVAATS